MNAWNVGMIAKGPLQLFFRVGMTACDRQKIAALRWDGQREEAIIVMTSGREVLTGLKDKAAYEALLVVRTPKEKAP